MFISSQLVCCHSSQIHPSPQAPNQWVTGSTYWSGSTMGRSGRAVQQPGHLLPAHCTIVFLTRGNQGPHSIGNHLLPHLCCGRNASCVPNHVRSHEEVRRGEQEPEGGPGAILSLPVCSLSNPRENRERDS